MVGEDWTTVYLGQDHRNQSEIPQLVILGLVLRTHRAAYCSLTMRHRSASPMRHLDQSTGAPVDHHIGMWAT